MTRFFVFAAVVALVIALPVTHEAFAGGNNTKVSICHVNNSNSPAVQVYTYHYGYYNYYEYGYVRTLTYHLGRFIEVDESAVAAHVDHGDSTGYALSEYTADYLTSWEDNDYGNSYGTPYVSSYWYYYSAVHTNAVIKNANCYWYTYVYEYPW